MHLAQPQCASCLFLYTSNRETSTFPTYTTSLTSKEWQQLPLFPFLYTDYENPQVFCCASSVGKEFMWCGGILQMGISLCRWLNVSTKLNSGSLSCLLWHYLLSWLDLWCFLLLLFKSWLIVPPCRDKAYYVLQQICQKLFTGLYRIPTLISRVSGTLLNSILPLSWEYYTHIQWSSTAIRFSTAINLWEITLFLGAANLKLRICTILIILSHHWIVLA